MLFTCTGSLATASVRWARGAIRACLSAALLFGLSASTFASPTVWVEPSLVRVRPADPAGVATQIDLHAAKGETESFQIIVQAPLGGLTNVNVEVGELGGPTATLFREHYVYINPGTTDWYTNKNKPEADGWYPDGLIPFIDPDTGAPPVGGVLRAVPFDLAEGQNQPIWVDLVVPRTLASGDYPCAFTVTSDEGETTVTANLHVWRFAIPRKPAMKSNFVVREVENRRACGLELLRNRLMPTWVEAEDERALIDTYGLNCTDLGFWSAANIRTGHIDPAPPVADIQQAMTLHQPDLYLYNFTADEVYITGQTVFFDVLLQWAQNLHAAGVDNMIVMPPVAALRDDGTGTGRSAVDIWVVLPKVYDVFLYDVYEALAKGDEVWSYNALVQDNYTPKWEIDFAPINYRIQPGFINQSLNLTGLLYWAVDEWTADTWNAPFGGYGEHYPGEGLLVYPGVEAGLVGVAPSLRLKYLRDGVDDYDYIQLLKDRGHRDWALGVARTVGPDWRNWTRDPGLLEAARIQLGDMLDSLPPPPAPSAEFSASVTEGIVPVTVQFTDQSAGYPSIWSWDFGDGAVSDKQNPIHTYLVPGLYTVTLTVSNDVGSHTAAKTDYIVVSLPDAVAAFEGGPVLGEAPLTVSFTDQSPENPIAWLWQFGDGASSTEQNPTHVYERPGAYTVRLRVTTAEGSGAIAKQRYVRVAFPDTPFTSDPPFWAAYHVVACTAANVVQGYEDGLYHPEIPVSRDQMAVYVARAINAPAGDTGLPDPPSTPTFSDVPADHWAYKQIEYAVSQNVVKGYEDGTYRPGEVVDRAQMAVYIARAIVAPTGEAAIPDPGPTPTFPDVPGPDNTWAWCQRHVEYLAARYVVTGYEDGNYHPEFAVTRDLMSAYIAWGFQLPM